MIYSPTQVFNDRWETFWIVRSDPGDGKPLSLHRDRVLRERVLEVRACDRGLSQWPWSCGTVTVAAQLALFPAASLPT